MKKDTTTKTKVTPAAEVAEFKPAPKLLKWLIILAVILGAGYFFIKNKSLVIAGTINGKPITRWQLEKAMNDRYASATFDDLASNLLLEQLAVQNGVSASKDDINQEIAATQERLGGKEALAATLQRIGYSDQRFREEVTIQVLVKKLAKKLFKAEVKDEEVNQFFQENKTLFPGKKFEDVKADILSNLEQQKLQEQFTTWFQEQRKNATVVSFIR